MAHQAGKTSKYLGRDGGDNSIKDCIKASNSRLKGNRHHSDGVVADCVSPPPAEVVDFVIKLSKATRPVVLYETLNKYLKGYVAHEESKPCFRPCDDLT
jgi:hypothetical protein